MRKTQQRNTQRLHRETNAATEQVHAKEQINKRSINFGKFSIKKKIILTPSKSIKLWTKPEFSFKIIKSKLTVKPSFALLLTLVNWQTNSGHPPWGKNFSGVFMSFNKFSYNASRENSGIRSLPQLQLTFHLFLLFGLLWGRHQRAFLSPLRTPPSLCPDHDEQRIKKPSMNKIINPQQMS